MEAMRQSSTLTKKERSKKLRCKICDKEAIRNTYCKSHHKAYENIIKEYEVWKKALEIPWKEYLSEIAKNQLTGEWAKEVARYLIKDGEEQNVT